MSNILLFEILEYLKYKKNKRKNKTKWHQNQNRNLNFIVSVVQ